MYVNKGHRHEYDMHPQDRERAAQTAANAWDVAEGMSLREAAAERRRYVKQWRLADLAGDEQGKADAVAGARSTRRSMARRINEL